MPVGLQSMIIEFAILAALAACVLGLAFYRYFVSREQEPLLHVPLEDSPDVARQSNVMTRLSGIDKWGKSLTVVTVVYFVVLMCVVMYQEWTRAATTMGN